MKVIIAGSRHIEDYELLEEAIKASGFEITKVVEGGARGVDSMARKWGDSEGIPVETHKADWDSLGKSAGPRRNEGMAKVADALIAIWDGESPGTKHMIGVAERRGLQVHVQYTDVEVEIPDEEMEFEEDEDTDTYEEEG